MQQTQNAIDREKIKRIFMTTLTGMGLGGALAVGIKAAQLKAVAKLAGISFKEAMVIWKQVGGTFSKNTTDLVKKGVKGGAVGGAGYGLLTKRNPNTQNMAIGGIFLYNAKPKKKSWWGRHKFGAGVIGGMAGTAAAGLGATALASRYTKDPLLRMIGGIAGLSAGAAGSKRLSAKIGGREMEEGAVLGSLPGWILGMHLSGKYAAKRLSHDIKKLQHTGFNLADDPGMKFTQQTRKETSRQLATATKQRAQQIDKARKALKEITNLKRKRGLTKKEFSAWEGWKDILQSHNVHE